jgi:hypothetical protein
VSSQAAAERRVVELAAQRDHARELERLAMAAAEEAVADRDGAQQQAAGAESQAARLAEQLDTASAAQARSEAERDAMTASVESARTAAEQLRAELDAERRAHGQQVEQLHTEHVTGLARIQAQAADEIRRQGELFAAELASIRARDDARHSEDRKQITALRKQLDSLQPPVPKAATAGAPAE